jgi:hypothetical protein
LKSSVLYSSLSRNGGADLRVQNACDIVYIVDLDAVVVLFQEGDAIGNRNRDCWQDLQMAQNVERRLSTASGRF